MWLAGFLVTKCLLRLAACLTLAGSTGWCGMAVVLSKMPWNTVEWGCGNATCCSV